MNFTHSITPARPTPSHLPPPLHPLHIYTRRLRLTRPISVSRTPSYPPDPPQNTRRLRLSTSSHPPAFHHYSLRRPPQHTCGLHRTITIFIEPSSHALQHTPPSHSPPPSHRDLITSTVSVSPTPSHPPTPICGFRLAHHISCSQARLSFVQKLLKKALATDLRVFRFRLIHQ